MVPPEIEQTLREALVSWRQELEFDEERMHIDKALEWLDTLPAAPAPDWSSAPEWAMWWAVDANGGAYWHTDKPSATVDENAWLANDSMEWDVTSMVCPNWRETLTARPTEDK
jgi:hypothetical protein